MYIYNYLYLESEINFIIYIHFREFWVISYMLHSYMYVKLQIMGQRNIVKINKCKSCRLLDNHCYPYI